MKTRDVSKVPGVILKEALLFGNRFEKVILVYFSKKYSHSTFTENVDVITMPYLDPKSPLRFSLSVILSYFLSIPVLFYIFVKHRINLVRADDIIISGFPSVLVSKLIGTCCIVSLLGDVEEVLKYKLRQESSTSRLILSVVNQIQKFVISCSDEAIVVNKTLLKIAEKFRSKHSSLMYPNVDLSIFNPERRKSDSKFRVLFVGRLEPEKGPLDVLRVAEKIRNVDFYIAGYGSLTKQIEQTMQEKDLSNVKLLGMVDHDNLPQLYNDSDVLLLPSYSEGLPIVMLEAMACEVPVIASNVGAIPEILENHGGIVVKAGDVDGMVSKLELLLQDQNLRLSMGKKARTNIVSRFNNFIESHVDLYTNVLARANKL